MMVLMMNMFGGYIGIFGTQDHRRHPDLFYLKKELWSADFEGVEGLSVAEGELARTFDQPELDDVI